MTSIRRILVGGGAVLALTLAGPTVSSAQADEPDPKPTPSAEFFATLPPAPAGCAEWWDPIEDAYEDSVPSWAEEQLEAFDDWCEGDSD